MTLRRHLGRSEKAESVLKPADKLSAVEARHRERWLQMVKKGWGLPE